MYCLSVLKGDRSKREHKEEVKGASQKTATKTKGQRVRKKEGEKEGHALLLTTLFQRVLYLTI